MERSVNGLQEKVEGIIEISLKVEMLSDDGLL